VSLSDYIQLIRRRWRIVAAVALVATAIATALSVTAQPMYASSVQLFVSAGQTGNAFSNSLAPDLLTQERITSYAQLASGRAVAAAVVRNLNLRESPAELSHHISATVPSQTVLIAITVTDSNSSLVPQIADQVGAQTAGLIEHLESPGRGAPSPVRVRIAEPASSAGAAVSPKIPRNIAFGVVVGLALGLALALIREVLDTRIKTVDDVSDLGLPVLGVIHYDRGIKSNPLLGTTAMHPSVGEAFRQLRTNLQFLDFGERPRSLLVASALPQEGKSTTVWNLAITLAAAGQRVIVVEADLRRPTLSRTYLGLRDDRGGLSDVLIGNLGLEEASVSWMDGRLMLLPSGTVPPNPSELLGSQSMSRLLARLGEHADLILIDAPPLLPFADAAVLAAMAGATLFILRAGGTRREHVRHARRLLEGVDARVCGAVLTMAPRKGPEGQHYGYYGYGYGEPPVASPSNGAMLTRLQAGTETADR
jgi:capsular exopolysaccharide synthesis family protein